MFVHDYMISIIAIDITLSYGLKYGYLTLVLAHG